MLPNPHKIRFKFKRPENGFPDSSLLGEEDTKTLLVDVSSSSSSASSSSSEDGSTRVSDNESNQSKALVVYEPQGNAIDQPPKRAAFQPLGRLPSVGAFTVQCFNCFKWRLIPTKEKYEAIREHILENPFFCKTAREWRPQISCDDPTDISQDGTRVWALDKPNIARPPSGWQRLLRIRGEGSTKFADVYYVAPSGKRLRSMVEIQKYLAEHPELVAEGLSMSRFSFRTPKPLQENYVRKRPPRSLAPCNANQALEPALVRPIAWASPEDRTELLPGTPLLSSPSNSESVDRPAKRQAADDSPAKEACDNDPKINPESS